MDTQPTVEGQVQLLTQLVRSLVDQPDLVRVHTLEGFQSTIFEVSVARPDVHRVIGRKGRTVEAIRDLMVSWGTKVGRRLLLEVMEPAHRLDEIPGDLGLSIPVNVERIAGPRLRVESSD